MVGFGGSFKGRSFRGKQVRRSFPGGNKPTGRIGGIVNNDNGRFGGRVGVASGDCHTNQSGTTSDNLSGSDRYRQNTPWQKKGTIKTGWKDSFGKAIFGDRERRQLRREEKKERVLNRQAGKINRGWRDGKLPEELLGMEIKIDHRVKPGEVKYDYRKNTVSISEADGLKKRELPKQIIQLAQSEKFRKTTGVGRMTAKKKRRIEKMLRGKGGAVERAGQKMSATAKHSRQGSSGRKVQLGSLVNKRFK
jgi:hypothetical protein